MSPRSHARLTPATAAVVAPTWPWAAAVVAIAAFVYLPTLYNGFIWDDPLVLDQLRAIHNLRDLLLPPAIIPKYYYRPLIFLSLLFDRTLGGEAPFWFHFSVVAGHAVNTGLLWWLGLRLFAAPGAAALAALLFAVHPIHVESVAWIAGRSDVVATAFLLVSTILLTYDRFPWTAPVAVAMYGLALLSKETALAGLLVLPLIDLALARRPRWRVTAAVVIVTVIYLLVRRVALGAAVTGFSSTATTDDMLRRLLAAIGFYISKLIVPINLTAYVPEVPDGWTLPAIGLLTTIALGCTAVVCWQRDERRVALLLVWFLCTLAPALMVIIRLSAQAPLADRYLYMPSAAACLLVARLTLPSAKWQSPIRLGSIAISITFAVMTLARGHVWADDLLFWQDVAAKAPSYALGHRELAQIYLRRDQLSDAEAALQRALQSKSDRDGRIMTLNNAATLYLRQQRLDDADRTFREALALYPHPSLYYGLGRLAVSRAEHAQAHGDGAEALRQVGLARDQLMQAVALDPTDAKAHALLGQVLYNLRDLPAARAHLQRALDLGAGGSVADIARKYLKLAGG